MFRGRVHVERALDHLYVGSFWVVAAIGIVAGAGFPILALIASAMVLVTLVVLGAIEARYLDRPDGGGDEDEANVPNR